MLTYIRRSVVSILVMTAFFGFVYMLAGTGVSQLFFHHHANGSITAYGSTLIGQDWSATKCPGHPQGSCVFHGRPDKPLVTNGVNVSGASNLGPRSQTLVDDTKQLVAYWKALGVDNPTPDLVTTSASGLDPDITPQDATVQIPMVSAATGIPASRLQALVEQQTHSAPWGFLGSDYINVLQLNEALAKLK